MTKVLFLLSAVVMVVAGFFSYQNRDTFIKLRKQRADSVKKLESELKRVQGINTEIGTVREKITATNGDVSTENERLAQFKLKLKNAEADFETVSKAVAENQETIEKYRKQLTDLPPGMTIENIEGDINKLKQSIADSQTDATKIQEQVTAKEQEVKKAQTRLDSVIEKIETRKKLFDRNSLTATIVAVNNDWGFVVIDGGENKGITVDTKLLITRGQDTIGRLNIIGVQGNKTVANIDQKSMRPGMAVAPGDRVVLESLYQ